MMDSQEKAPIEEQKMEQDVTETTAVEAEQPETAVEEPERKQYQTKKET